MSDSQSGIGITGATTLGAVTVGGISFAHFDTETSFRLAMGSALSAWSEQGAQVAAQQRIALARSVTFIALGPAGMDVGMSSYDDAGKVMASLPMSAEQIAKVQQVLATSKTCGHPSIVILGAVGEAILAVACEAVPSGGLS